MTHPEIRIAYPEWVDEVVDWDIPLASDEDRMTLAIALSRENVLRGNGGPFGALVVEAQSGRVVAAGMNLVLPRQNSMLHAEIVALMMAEQRLGRYSLGGDVRHELVSSCDPCAMCLGAALWSGITRLVCGADREDAERIDFDEGPVFAASYEYLRHRGIAVTRGVCRAEARQTLELYRRRSGAIYNP